MLPFLVDQPRLASLLMVAQQEAQPSIVGGRLNSTNQGMYELIVTEASFGDISLKYEA